MKYIEVMKIFQPLISQGNKLELPKHTAVFHHGSVADSFYIITEGSVSVHKEKDGNSFMIGELTRGDIFGELGLFQKDHHRSTRITCREASKLVEIKYQDFHQYLKSDNTPLMYLYNMLSIRLEETTNRTESIVTQDVIHRVWDLLVELAKKDNAVTHPQGRQIRISRKEIGQMIGCSREMAGKAVAELASSDKISSSGKTLVIYGEY